MTYSFSENSLDLGTPIETYEFANGINIWRYTSSDSNQLGSAIRPTLVYNSSTGLFISEQIQRTEVSESQELNKINIKITLPRENAVAALFLFYPPNSVTTVTIQSRHTSDNLHETLTLWMGRVLNAEFLEERVELHCEPITTSIRRLGLRQYYQRQCPHILYGENCSVLRENFAVTATVKEIPISNTLQVILDKELPIPNPFPSGVDNNYFAGGMMTWTVPNKSPQWRFISTSSTDSFTVNLPFKGRGDTLGRDLSPGQVITLYPGCQHTLTECKNKFNNLDNFGGFPFIPLDNPFSAPLLY